MISKETAQAFLGELSSEKDQTVIWKEIATFMQNEPFFFSLFMVAFGNDKTISNPLTVALCALTFYEKMRKSQEESERLGNIIGDQSKEKGT